MGSAGEAGMPPESFIQLWHTNCGCQNYISGPFAWHDVAQVPIVLADNAAAAALDMSFIRLYTSCAVSNSPPQSLPMNTYRIYEDFKATLGDAAAKSLAQTLGAMFDELKDTVTKEDFRILRESIDANVSPLDGAIARLAEAQIRTEQAVQTLAEAMQRRLGKSMISPAQTSSQKDS